MPSPSRLVPALALASALVGCTDRPLGDTELGTGSGTGDPGTATLPTSGGTATTATTSTSGPGTTTGPGTTGLPTSTSAASVTVSTSGPPPPDMGGDPCGDGWCSPEESCETCPVDCSCWLPDALIQGCPEVYAWDSAVVGVTPFGPFNGSAAAFAWEGIGDAQWSWLTLHVFDASVPFDAAKQDGPYGNAVYALRTHTDWSYAESQWIKAEPVLLEVYRDFKGVTYDGVVEIYDRAGSWEAYDPDDPPLLFGNIKVPGDPEGVQGPFTAVFCDALVSQIIPE